MKRREQIDNACTNWICSQENGKVIKAREVWRAAVKWADQHPHWKHAEEELPPHRNQTNHKFENDFSVNCFVSDGRDVDTGYYDYRLRKWNCEFLTNVVYWYSPQPPRKED